MKTLELAKEVQEYVVKMRREFHMNPEPSMKEFNTCLLYTSPSPRDRTRSRMPSSA